MSTIEAPAAADEIVICVMAHAGPAGFAQRAERMRASDPRVRCAPHLFRPDATPESEWPGERDDIVARDDQAEAERVATLERQARANRVKLQTPAPPALLRATRDVIAHEAGRPAVLSKGSVILASDPRALIEPDAWERVSVK
jgi:hypothetical protein